MFVINNNEATFRDTAPGHDSIENRYSKGKTDRECCFLCKGSHLISKLFDYFNKPVNVTGSILL
ncbi:MAG TPA: hypothetical protein VFG46_11495, partial [Chryseolinea sp.]|nr:hypothetical protein [Chryseolinea sp.]